MIGPGLARLMGQARLTGAVLALPTVPGTWPASLGWPDVRARCWLRPVPRYILADMLPRLPARPCPRLPGRSPRHHAGNSAEPAGSAAAAIAAGGWPARSLRQSSA